MGCCGPLRAFLSHTTGDMWCLTEQKVEQRAGRRLVEGR